MRKHPPMSRWSKEWRKSLLGATRPSHINILVSTSLIQGRFERNHVMLTNNPSTRGNASSWMASLFRNSSSTSNSPGSRLNLLSIMMDTPLFRDLCVFACYIPCFHISKASWTWLTTTCKAKSRSKSCVFGNPLSMGHTQCSFLRSEGFWWCRRKCFGHRDVDASTACRAERIVGRVDGRLEALGISSPHEFVVWKRRVECQGEFSEPVYFVSLGGGETFYGNEEVIASSDALLPVKIKF